MFAKTLWWCILAGVLSSSLQGVQPSPPLNQGPKKFNWLVISARLALQRLTPPWCKDQQHWWSAKPLYTLNEEQPQLAGHKYGQSSYTVEGIWDPGSSNKASPCQKSRIPGGGEEMAHYRQTPRQEPNKATPPPLSFLNQAEYMKVSLTMFYNGQSEYWHRTSGLIFCKQGHFKNHRIHPLHRQRQKVHLRIRLK